MSGVDALLLGCPATGKTLLVRHIRAICSRRRQTIEADTEETTGMELDTLEYFARPFSVQESGGKMAPMWSAYYGKARMMIYVVDCTSREHLSQALMHLMELQCETKSRNQPLLVLLNKVDLRHRMTREELDRVLCLRDMAEEEGGHITVLETSALTGKNVELVIRWIVLSKNTLHAAELEARRQELLAAEAAKR